MLRRTVTVLLLIMALMMITSFPATAISDENVRVIIELETDSVIEKQSEFRLLGKEMSSKQISKLREQLVSNQVSVKKEIKAEKIDIDYHYSFVNLINGFSGTASFSDLEKIGNLPGVKEVRISKTYKIPPLQPNMTTSKETVNVLTTWNLGYEGEGKAVAIIDSTVDHTHKDMRLSDDVEMKLTKEEVEAIIENDNLFGRWFSDKVPYGYNYGDNNDHLPTNQSHGMHVAGIVAANTDDETKGIKGVAPEAQLFAMKIISDDDGFIYDDAILKAMDDSVPLKADVINLSLGSTAQFKGPESVLYETIQKLVGNGVVPVIAAGNSGYMGWEYQHPYARNPDIGVVGTPGIIDGSLCVASIDNVTMYKSIQFREYKIPYWAYSEETDPLTTFNDDDMQYIDCKEGIFISEVQNDFNGLDIAGKIALIKRGTISFEDKIRNAENLGAAGVIIYNHEAGGNKLIEMEYDTEAVTIPAVFIGNNHGEIMKNAEEIEKVFKFTNIEVPIGGDMSDFTSWGTSPSLDFKPDITAPGGGIYSTLPDNKYAIYSGTSMACPYVAGGTALILQRMEENDYLNLSGIDRVNMVKNLLMSTAHPQEFKDGIEISPRRQGAGLMDLYAAATTNAIITDKITGLSKVNLKETGSSATFTISLTNFGNEDLEYAVRGSVLTSLPYSYEEGELVYIDPDRETKVVDASTKNMPITFAGISEGTISVSAGTTKEFTVLLDLSNPVCELENASTGEISLQSLNTIFSNGTFIEGFISLTSEDETVPSLSIPYMGFYGNWDQAPIFDHSIYEENQQAFYNMTFEEEFRGTYLQSGETILGIRGDFIDPLLVAISPNGDGEQDDVQAVVELLRNAKEIDIDILNEAKVIVHEFEASEYHVKNYDSYFEPPLELSTWDGKISENVIDGNYIYRVKARIDFEDSQWQTLEFPFRVDTLPPIIESADYNENEDTITVVANDGIFTGIRYLLHQESKGIIAESESGIFDLGNLSPRPSQVQVMVKDAAANSTLSDIITLDTDETAPIVYLESPENRGFYNNPELSVNGYIVEGGILTSFKVNDRDIDFTYNSDESRYEFEDVISFDDGAHQLEVAAVDNSNNTYTSQAAFFMDTAAPIITMTKIPPVSVSSGTETITISATIDENMGYLEVLLNDDPRYLKEIDPSNEEEVLLPVHYDMSLERVSLEYGNNLVILKAIDKAGNESVNEFQVNRLRPGEGSTTGGGSGGALPLDPSSNSQIVNPDLGQTLSIKGASIELPQGAVGGKVQISVQELSSFSNPPGQNRLLSQVYEFTKDKAGNFLKPVLITLTFNPAEIDRNIHEPVLCWLNELTQQWEVLEDSRFDWDTNTISGSINHFTKFAVLAYPIEIKMIDIEGHWAQENIKKMVNQKIISGYEDNSFRPNNEISRAEFSTMLVKYLNLDHTLELDEESFTDIKAHWAEDYIKAAYASGIVNGYNSTHFGPNDYITREQMAVMIGKAIKIKASSETMTFNDTHRVSPWAASFVAAAVHEELLTGYPDTSFRPKNKTTRAEAVTVISKLEKQ